MQNILFNPSGDDSLNKRTIIKGNSTKLFNLNEVKYQWSQQMYRVMHGNTWFPEKVSMRKDVLDFNILEKNEKNTFKKIISFLTFLDSIQTNNIPNIKAIITAPEVSSLLSIQENQEVIHSQSYSYILESLIPDKQERLQVYELWRDDKILLTRNSYIAKIYQDYLDDNNDISLFKAIIANYILESLYFYNGFIFFYNLSSRNLMQGTADEIRYINRDELTHIQLFANIINEIKVEFPRFFIEDIVYELFSEGVKAEISWSNYALEDGIIGMDSKSTEQYTHYLANNALAKIGLPNLFAKVESPYKMLEQQADLDNSSIKSNFFEATVTNYTIADTLDGWDDF